MDFWSKGLRGGDNGVTPRRTPLPKQGAIPAGAQTEKAKADKPLTPGLTTGFSTSRMQFPATARKPTPLMTDSPENQSRMDSPSKAGSVYSGDGDADGTEDFENDSVRVFVRVRPPTEQEIAHDKHEQCLSVIGSRTLQLAVRDKQNTTHRFMFDQVLPEDTPQQDVFDLAGLVAVDNCLAGYNSSIFAYGQTGAGKTFTVIGQINSAEKRGLAPRVFEYLFAKITDHENSRGPDTVKYNCRCAFLEIYNETIADLLCPNSVNLPIREDPEKGPYVDGLSEPPALNVDEMLQHLLRGADNRHTGETRLNRESSRSHSVFMCTVEKTVTSNGISKCFYAKLNLVDLAGSERIASGAHGGSNATGEHFKEACHINKSLTALGRVTTELVKSQKNGGGGHVPYRDSKLTFLLQSSLGGNAKTLIIANVSPSSICSHETLSTLRFAKQTKHIRNDAKVNWTVQGDRLAMQREIERLRMELAGMRSGITEPLVQANEELTARLEEEQQRRDELQQERERVVSALNQARRENRLLDQRLVGLAAISGMDGSRGAGALATVVEQLEVMDANTCERSSELAEVERELTALQLQIEQSNRTRLTQQLHASHQERESAVIKCGLLEAQLVALTKEKIDLEESCSVLAENFSQAGAKITEQKEQLAAQLADLQESSDHVHRLERQLADEQEARAEMERHLQEARAKHTAAVEETERTAAHGVDLQARLDDKQAELGQQGSRMEGLERQLEGALAEVQLLQSRLAETQEQLAQTQHASTASHGELSDQIMHLMAKLEESDAKALRENARLEEVRCQLQAALDDLELRSKQVAEIEGQLQLKTDECSSALRQSSALESDLAVQVDAHSAAEAEVASLLSQLSQLREQLAASDERGEEKAVLLQQVQIESAGLAEQLSAKASAVEHANKRAAAAQQHVMDLTVRTEALEEKAAAQSVAHATLESSFQQAERVVADLEATVAGLHAQLETAQVEHTASEERVASLRTTVLEMEARTVELQAQLQELDASKASLEVLASKQAAQMQAQSMATAALESRLHELEAAKASLSEQLEQEQTNVTTHLKAISQNQDCIAELRKQIEQEEAQTLSTLREMSGSAAAAQRQITELEEQHLQEVQSLKNDLDRRSTELKARDQEMVRTNFALKGEIDRLQASLEQSKRESAAGKANQEQLVVSHQAMIAGMNERLAKQADRYSELSKKHDALKAQLDHAQREIESWKTKCERLDLAMADVTRLIRFARNPPDSARSSLIMTRSDHLSPNLENSRWASAASGSRAGMASGVVTGITPGSVSLRITESPAESPRIQTSRYTASSPAGSKVGSGGITASHRIHGCDDDGEEWESARRVPDIVSPGDQLPIPDAED